MEIKFVDIHAHLACKEAEKIINKVEKYKDEIIIVNCALNEKELEKAFELQNKFNFIYISAGLYPLDALEISEKELEKYVEKIKENKDKIVLIGEIGLDNSLIKESSKKEKAKEFFEFMLEFSKEIGKPVILHARNAYEEVYKILLKHDIKKAIFHYYEGKISLAKRIVEDKYFISINNAIKYKNEIKNVVKNIDLNFLLTETDSPWPLKRLNEPINVKECIEEISKIKNLSFEEVKQRIYFNSIQFLNI